MNGNNAILRGFVVDGGTVFAGINLYSGNNLAENNEVRNMIQCPIGQSPGSGGCQSWADADGFRFFGSNNIMRGNYIHDNSYANSQNDGSNSPPHIDCFQTWNDSSNHAPAVNTRIEYNICDNYSASPYHATSGIELDDANGTIVSHNIFHTYGKKLDLDTGNSNTTIENNVFLGGPKTSVMEEYGIFVSEGAGTIVRNNIFYGILNSGMNIYFKISGQVTATNNLLDIDPKLDSTFHPLSGSPVCNTGTSGTFIGVYPCGTTTIIPTPTKTPTPSPTPTGKPGDANGDNKVDGVDYVIWLNHYNQTITGGATVGDFNTSGIVDGVDYVVWLNNFGK